METSISFPEEEDDEKNEFFDAFLPNYGWLPVKRQSPTTVSILRGLSEMSFSCPSHVAPLFSQSLNNENSELKPGQCVLVWNESEWVQGMLLSPSGNRFEVETVDQRILKARIEDIRPFGTLLPSLFRSGLCIIAMRGDGNCLYRAVSHQLYGNPTHHIMIRQVVCDYLEIEQHTFEPFVGNEDYNSYLQTMRRNGAWGDDLELQVFCEIYQRRLEIYVEENNTPQILKRFQRLEGRHENQKKVLRLWFHASGHYDSLIEIAAHSGSDRLVVGELETKALEQARWRRAGGISEGVRQSDVFETEQVQVNEIGVLQALEDANKLETEDMLLELALQASLEDEVFNSILRESTTFM